LISIIFFDQITSSKSFASQKTNIKEKRPSVSLDKIK